MEAREFLTRETMRDGAPVWIRAIRPDDQARLAALFDRLSPESVYFRFFELKRSLSARELRYLTELDFERRVVLGACLEPGREAPIVGVARFDVLPPAGGAPVRAELGIVVEDAHHNRDIGTLVLKHLLAIAHEKGVEQITADVLPQNTKVLELVANSGVPVRQTLDEGVIHLSL